MRREWTEQTAIKALGYGVIVNNKMISTKSGLKGLTACSAKDFLTNNCGYKYLSIIPDKNIENRSAKKNDKADRKNHKDNKDNRNEITYATYNHIPARARISDILMAKMEAGRYVDTKFMNEVLGVKVV